MEAGEGGVVVDLGCGPSICSIISASRSFRLLILVLIFFVSYFVYSQLIFCAISPPPAGCRWSREIYLAELLGGNRREVERWLGEEEGAFDWQHYLDFQVAAATQCTRCAGSAGAHPGHLRHSQAGEAGRGRWAKHQAPGTRHQAPGTRHQAECRHGTERKPLPPGVLPCDLTTEELFPEEGPRPSGPAGPSLISAISSC